MTLLYLSVSVSHDVVTVGKYAQYQEPHIEAAKKSAVTNLFNSSYFSYCKIYQ